MDKISRMTRPIVIAMGVAIVLTIALVISELIGPGALIALGPEFFLMFHNVFN